MHQNGSPNKGWLQLGTECALQNFMSDINVGDLPPKSPEFYAMLPSLRSSPSSQFQAKKEENRDSFHVVPTLSTPSEARSIANTYESFLRTLESNENEHYGGDLPLSAECHNFTKHVVGGEISTNLSDDFQIYFQNEISPTPVDKLYSTLPVSEAARTFDFPSFDENQRLENMNVAENEGEASANEYKMTNGSSIEEMSQNTEYLCNPLFPRGVSKRKGKHRYYTGKSAHVTSLASKESKRLDDRGNRLSHNDIERQRRNDMKSRFDSLKSVIPEIEKLERAPKIQILSRATEFINKLHLEEKRLDNEKELERKRNRLLLDKLVQLTKV